MGFATSVLGQCAGTPSCIIGLRWDDDYKTTAITEETRMKLNLMDTVYHLLVEKIVDEDGVTVYRVYNRGAPIIYFGNLTALGLWIRSLTTTKNISSKEDETVTTVFTTEK